MSAPSRAAELRRLLERYIPADAREAEHRRRMEALAGAPGDPFARTAFDPGHFTASAFVLSPSKGAVLLVFHAKLKKWLQPGGHVDPSDENVEAAARRETQEEAGVAELRRVGDGELFDLDVHPIPARPHEPAHEHFDVRLLFIAENEAVQAGSDALDVRWAPLAELQSWATDESVARAAEKLRKRGAPPPPHPRSKESRGTS